MVMGLEWGGGEMMGLEWGGGGKGEKSVCWWKEKIGDGGILGLMVEFWG